MKKSFCTYADVLASPWGALRREEKPPVTDRVLRSTKLEDSIYVDLRSGDSSMDELEAQCSPKLKTFPALSRDIFQSMYSLIPRKNEEQSLSATARKLNAKLLEHVMESEDYPVLKDICEGRDLPSYEASGEFVTQVSDSLDELLENAGGDKGALNTLEKLEHSKQTQEQELAGLLEQLEASGSGNATLEQAVVDAANKADSKARQVEAVSKLVDANMAKNKDDIRTIVHVAAHHARERAEEVQNAVRAWSDEPGNMGRSPANLELLKMVKENDALARISKYLGRFREIFAQGKKNGYAYGRGEKYSLELGNDISRALSSELVMLASPETTPIFLRKYQRKQIKQYRRREPIYKGAGDIICCLDESGSMAGDLNAWGKAVALTLLDIAAGDNRSFALIHFSGPSSVKTDIFRPSQYTMAEKMAAAQTFLDGGTDFESPMWEAMRLMTEQRFENADIVFITDGMCHVSDAFIEELKDTQSRHAFEITGILLDQGDPGMDFSLKSFCQTIYRTSELMGDDIARKLICDRA